MTYLEADRRLVQLGDTGPWATRARAAYESVVSGPYLDTASNVVDGRGVGVAVIDTGVDGTHPDLAARMGRNFKIVCTTGPFTNTATGQCAGPLVMREETSSDTTGGHGTHVAGIGAGDGTASSGTFRGVAPGATIHGFGTGEATLLFTIATSFQYILDHYDDFTPRIRVINNSWGDAGGTPHDPNSVVSKLVRASVERGMTVVFAAGNEGGTGSADRTSSYSKDPTPGVISAANYDDANNGTRSGSIWSSSSRGAAADPRSYPDLAAPGTGIVASCTQYLSTCTRGAVAQWAPHYSSLTGTSMAAPHIAAAAALVYQARPNATPAQVEDVLQDTAHKFNAGAGYVSDPQNLGGTTSFEKGAGLLDVPAALDALGVAHRGPTFRVGAPTVAITSPAMDSTLDATSLVDVAGTAHDGRPPVAVIADQPVTDGDGGDVEGPGAADIVGLSVREEGAGMRYDVRVRDVLDVGPGDAVTLRVTQKLDGRPFTTDVDITRNGATPLTSSSATFAPAQSATRDVLTNTVSFTVPFSALGNPPAGAPAHNVFVSSFVGTIVDVAPGGAGIDIVTRPRHGAAYTIVRPGEALAPSVAVTLHVDDGAAIPGVVQGTGPEYRWGALLDPTGLDDGTHTLTARLHVNGLVASMNTITFTVARPTYTHAVAITSHADGDVLDRGFVTLAGTASSDAPLTRVRLVTLQLASDGVDTGETTATGADNWEETVDTSVLPAGAYTVTARLYLDGVTVAGHTITLRLPEVPVSEVSCLPEALSFWRKQYSGQAKRGFTAAEADALAQHAAKLSIGYFADAPSLLSALLAEGTLTTRARAERQYSALLLNLAAGDLSATMSRLAGLSGAEPLSAKTYDVQVLGSTVDSAARWIRAQLPDGDVGGANEVATLLNRGAGLAC